MPTIPTLLEMFKAGLHFGHQVSKRHPKMEPYIYTQKNSVHIINLELTQKKLQEALDYITKTVSRGGTVLFLGTKKQAQKIVKESAINCQMPFITERWLGGTFTNFNEISKIIKKFTDLKQKKSSGQLEKYTKKEQLRFNEEIEKLNTMVGGIENMKTLPNAIFIFDVKKEKSAVAESCKKKIPIVGICDSNVNPDKVDYLIPANDDSVSGINLVAKLVTEAVLEGLRKRAKKI